MAQSLWRWLLHLTRNVVDEHWIPAFAGMTIRDCHPGSCNWVRVRSVGNDDMCTQGDSGGPFFAGNTAVGTMAFCVARSSNDNPSGENDDDDAIYMKVNYFRDLDLTVLKYGD